jgi:ribosomal protein S18 acetylase RimI-like enzyme
MKLKPIFRQATKDDAAAIAQLHAKVYGQPECIKSLREEWQKHTDGRGEKSVHVCVNQATNTIIGAIFSRPKAEKKNNRLLPKTKDQEREIVDIFVDTQFQNQSIARRLLVENLRNSDNRNARTTLSVSSTNAPAIHLYATLGFRVVPQKKQQPTTLVMSRAPHFNPH